MEQSDFRHNGDYALVLANNRDELWDRPTSSAHFWGPGNTCFSARDEVHGRKGGTWLGLNRNGKLAVMHNIFGHDDFKKKGRGFLVSEYLSSDVGIQEYSQSVASMKDNYRGFNLVLFDFRVDKDSFACKPIYISNANNYPSNVKQAALPVDTCLGLANSAIEYPFKKVVRGRKAFGRIVKEYSHSSQKEILTQKLLELMSDQTCLLPDAELERAGVFAQCSPLLLKQYSSINIFSPQKRFGTRTSTVILIDKSGHVEYVEKNFKFTTNSKLPEERVIHECFELWPAEEKRRLHA